MKYVSSAVATVLLGAFAGCRAPEIADVTFELPASESLCVNTETKHYRTVRSREQGENELIALAKTSELEEGWLYKDNEWVEVGFSEQARDAHVDAREPFLSFGAKGVFYHIHPHSGVEQMWKDCNRSLEKELETISSDEGRQDIKRLLRDTNSKRNYLLNSFPSGNDLKLLACYPRCAVASEFGVVEARRTTNVVKEFNETLAVYDADIQYDSRAEHAMIVMYLQFGKLMDYFEKDENKEKCLLLFNQEQWDLLDT
ncbi:MAG: hypothetical protein AABY01_01890 [Nanoarchaeota archaeon]